MSLLISCSLKTNKHLSPSFGDRDFDPELTRDSISFTEDDESQDEQHCQVLSNSRVDSPELRESEPSILFSLNNNTNKALIPQYKPLPVQNGKFIPTTNQYDISACTIELHVPEAELKHAIDVNYKKHHDGSLEMINQHLIKRQKQVLGFLVKQFGSALFRGKSLASLSLPVTVFEPQSQLERDAKSLAYAPYFLERGGTTNNRLEQFKCTVAHFICSLHLETTPQKPFSPIVGETFQGKLGSCSVYAEQISHHPSKYALQMIGKNFMLDGVNEFTTHISVNSVKSCKVGTLKVTYRNTNVVVRGQHAPGLTGGIAIGKRSYQITDKCYVFDIENRYYTEVSFDGNEGHLFKRNRHTKDQFSGAIWKINDNFAEKLKQVVKKPEELAEIKFKEKEHAVSKVDNIEGSWLESLKIGEVVYWSFGSVLPWKLEYVENSLPSDSNFRMDISNLRRGDEDEAERCKELLEGIQRNDLKLREKNKKHMK